MVPEFEAATLASEVGRLYPDLVETSYGYHIIYRPEVRGSDQMDYDSSYLPYTVAEYVSSNLFGNIALFVPVGVFWPLCFGKLDRVWKVVLAGFFFSLLIELSQLLFYERSTDIDDLILNTLGVWIGALLFFALQKGRRKKEEPHA